MNAEHQHAQNGVFMVTSHGAEVTSPLNPAAHGALRASNTSTARGPVRPISRTAEQLWDLHGASLYALAFGLLGDQPAAVRAVTLGMTDFVIQAESHPGSETSEALQHLSHLVYRRCEAVVDDAPLSRTMTTMPPLMVWLGELLQLQRACLALCVFGGHTYREAANLLGLSPVTVAGMLTTGLHQLADRASSDG